MLSKLNFSSSFRNRKIGGNFRQIIVLNNLDICGIFKNIYVFPQLVNELIATNASMFPGMIHKCPYKFFKIYNATISAEEKYLETNAPNRSPYPNGLYRNRIAVFDDLDKNIVELTYFYELYSYLKSVELK